MVSHWVYSITTRIKTILSLLRIKNIWAHWVYSITTRIKTYSLNKNYVIFHSLIEYIPLQQGLRPTNFPTCALMFPLIEYIPLQQGLRHLQIRQQYGLASPHWVYSITTRIKTCSAVSLVNSASLIEYIPLQQGLRLKIKYTISGSCTHWVYSITTRIKTRVHFTKHHEYIPSLSIFHYNKD